MSISYQFLSYSAVGSVVRRKELQSPILTNPWLLDVQGTTKINIAVDRLPMFRACARTDNTPGPEHYGTIHLGADWYNSTYSFWCFVAILILVPSYIHVTRDCLCSMDDIDIAYREALLGRASSRPVIEMTIPSVLDQTIAPPGLSCHSILKSFYVLSILTTLSE